MPNKLEEARRTINETDQKMAELFVRRMRAVEQVYEHKKQFGLPIRDEDREREIVARNAALVEDETLKSYYIDFLQSVMSLSRAYQTRMQGGLKVAYSGVEGAFAHIASARVFSQGKLTSYGDFQAAYNAVVRGECDVCVLPIENSYAGEVGQTMDLIFSGDLFINGIYELEIHQNLLGTQDAALEDIVKVASHPQAISQCREYIETRALETQEVANTALAAKMVAQLNDKTLGAIASAQTAELYGLKVIAPSINKSGENTTRFAVLSKVKADSPETLSSTVLMLTVKHEAGSLANAVSIIARYGYNMTALRSRPMKQHSWQYYFYIEVDGTVESENGRAMLCELDSVCDRLKVAGTFAPHAQL